MRTPEDDFPTSNPKRLKSEPREEALEKEEQFFKNVLEDINICRRSSCWEIEVENYIIRFLSCEVKYDLEARGEGPWRKAFQNDYKINKKVWDTVAKHRHEKDDNALIKYRYAKLLYYIGEEETSLHWLQEAWEQESWRIRRGKVENSPSCLSRFPIEVAEDFKKKGKKDEANKWLMAGVTAGNSDCEFALGDLALEDKKFDEALSYYKSVANYAGMRKACLNALMKGIADLTSMAKAFLKEEKSAEMNAHVSMSIEWERAADEITYLLSTGSEEEDAVIGSV